MRRAALLLGLTLLAAQPASAQMDSREGIALQNQILQLRQEMEQLRRGGGGSPPPVSSRGGGSAGSSELVGSLLDRVNSLQDEVSRLRGRVDVLENQNRRLREDFEKYQGDMDFRLGQGGGGAAAPGPSRTSPAVAPPSAPPTTTSGGPPPRTPDRALSEGNAALGRRDYAAAEAAAREVLASRSSANTVAAQMLLADALTGKRDFGNAAIAYNEAFTRARTGPRAPEALIGLASSFQSLGNKREACDTLNDLRSQFPNLRPPLAAQAAAARQRAQCR